MDVWNRTSNDFDANQTSGNVTFAVQFTDTSYNATSWFWIFDGFNTSTEQSPTFDYAVPGIYSVNHSSSNAHDTSGQIKAITLRQALYRQSITVNSSLTCQPALLQAGTGRLVTGISVTLTSPPHTYAYPGQFTVSLNVSNSAGSNSFTRTNYITVSATPTITRQLTPTITPTQPTITPTQPSVLATVVTAAIPAVSTLRPVGQVRLVERPERQYPFHSSGTWEHLNVSRW